MLDGTGPRSRPDAHAPLLDELVFDELRESLAAQPDALADVYRKFLQSAESSINALHEQDAAARISTVHTLKGSAAMLGANRLAALAAQLQEQFSRSQAPALDEVTRQLHDELAAFQHSINARLGLLGQQQI